MSNHTAKEQIPLVNGFQTILGFAPPHEWFTTRYPPSSSKRVLFSLFVKVKYLCALIKAELCYQPCEEYTIYTKTDIFRNVGDNL